MALQLEMTFDKKQNSFLQRLNSGKFFVLIEAEIEKKNVSFDSTVSKLSTFEFTTSEIDYIPTGLAFTDLSPSDGDEPWNIVDLASQVASSGRDNHLIYLSGRNKNLSEIAESIDICHASGFYNIVPVSGDAFPNESIKTTSKRIFTESVHTLNHIKAKQSKSLLPGCVFNPFKYTPSDTFAQYFKLIKKLNQGAGFIVTQFGWDMMKLQELRWYLTTRSMHYPSIARLLFLTPERVADISSGICPGVHISDDFRKILEKEIRFSHKQFESAQWRRIQLQSAGCHLLGYSGVQISGLKSVEHIKVACRRIYEAINEFTNFNDWLEAYYEYLARSEMAPYPHCFYMFDGLFSKAHLNETPKMNDANLPESSLLEKVHYRICKSLFSQANRQMPNEHLISKKVLTGCKTCGYCRLPLTHYICPETCPKGLSNGACGGTKANGNCELGNIECIHSKRMRLANWLNEIDTIEERYIKIAEKG